MNLRLAIAAGANFFIIAGLILYGFGLFAEYHEKGKWAKNITGLLAGLGMMTLALALVSDAAQCANHCPHRADEGFRRAGLDQQRAVAGGDCGLWRDHLFASNPLVARAQDRARFDARVAGHSLSWP